MYIGCCSFQVCTHCTRMYNGEKCPECGNPVFRHFHQTTPEERKRWEAKLYFADPDKENEHGKA